MEARLSNEATNGAFIASEPLEIPQREALMEIISEGLGPGNVIASRDERFAGACPIIGGQ